MSGPTNYTHLFGSPLMVHRWQDGPTLNAGLLPLILAEEAHASGKTKSNVGGWHSAYGALEFCGEPGAALLRRMREMADEATARVYREYDHAPAKLAWTVDAWANVNRRGDFNRTHTHPGSTWSGTYYVDTGVDGEATAAALQLVDPCQGRANTFLAGIPAVSFTVKPEPGLMVLFPSYIPHTVYPHAGDRPRVSIAFNLRREPYP